MFKEIFRTWFDWFWWFGFFGAIAIVILIKMGIMENTWIVLGYGIGHMIILTFAGAIAVGGGRSNIDIGHRISTMGYLHTLIGTSVALILASNNESIDILNQMNLIILPIGSALITSIIGWAVGTEMERSIHGTREETIVDTSLQNLSYDINNLSKELKKSTKQWCDSIDETIESLSASTVDLEDKYGKALSSSSDKLDKDSKIIMDKYFKSFDNLFKQIEKQINDSSNNSIKVMTNLMVAFEAIFKRMDDQAKEIEKNFMISNNSANKVVEDLSLSYQKLSTQTKSNVDRIEKNLNKSGDNADEAIERFIKSFENLFNTMQTYSNIMQKDFETSTNDAKKTMDELSNSFKKVFGLIGGVSKEWEQHISDMQDFANSSRGSLGGLLNDSRRIAREIQAVADGMPNSTKILREAEDILEILRVIKENDVP